MYLRALINGVTSFTRGRTPFRAAAENWVHRIETRSGPSRTVAWNEFKHSLHRGLHIADQSLVHSSLTVGQVGRSGGESTTHSDGWISRFILAVGMSVKVSDIDKELTNRIDATRSRNAVINSSVANSSSGHNIVTLIDVVGRNKVKQGM